MELSYVYEGKILLVFFCAALVLIIDPNVNKHTAILVYFSQSMTRTNRFFCAEDSHAFLIIIFKLHEK